MPHTIKKIPPILANPILIWVYYVRLQLHFYQVMCSLMEKENQVEYATIFKVTALDNCLNQCKIFLDWVDQELIRDEFEHALIEEISKQYAPICKLKLTSLYPQDDTIQKHQNTMRIRFKILQERVMEYIALAVQDASIVRDTQNIIAKIKEDITIQKIASIP